jgi:hypothetical protein
MFGIVEILLYNLYINPASSYNVVGFSFLSATIWLILHQNNKNEDEEDS